MRESEYNRRTGCGKTARPGLCGGRQVTGVPTVRWSGLPRPEEERLEQEGSLNRITGICLFIALALCDYLTVGTPVTWRPPHSPGRAVFPHPVPRLYSLSRKAFALCKYAMFSVDNNHFGFGDPQPVDGFAKNRPGKAFALPSSSVQPFE